MNAVTSRSRRRPVSVIAVALCGGVLAVLALLGAAKPRAPAPPPPPPPQVALTLTANAPDRDWTVKLTNTGADPIRIVADSRLLSFEVTNAARVQTCRLPADMVPTSDTVRTLVIPPQRSWSAKIDPIFYCYASAQAASLQVGASVVASFGFLAPRYAPPFAIAPVTAPGVDAGVFPARSVNSQSVMLAAATAAAVASATSARFGTPVGTAAGVMIQNPNEYPAHLKTSLPERLDVSRAFEQSVNVSIVNEGDRPVRTLMTPPVIGFFVELPSGQRARCGADSAVGAIAELVSTLAPHGRTSSSIDLGALCGGYLRSMGLYRVRPRLDTRHATPPPGPAAFWQGESIGAPMLVRIREGEDPLPSPRLDPVATTP